jgi:hypothetical protein
VTSLGNGHSKKAGADLPTESIPAMVAPSRRSGPAEGFDLPEIVPATTEGTDGGARSGHSGPPTESVQAVPTRAQYEALVLTAGPDAAAPPVGALRVVSRRPRVRRVTRVVRHLDPWSVFKVAALFHFAAYLVTLTSGALLWRVAASTGTLDNVERWFTQFGWETFELDGGEVYHNAWIAGLFLVVAMTGVTVLLATLFNLISDLVGGVRVSVLEEEVVATGPNRTRIRRPGQRGEGGLGG